MTHNISFSRDFFIIRKCPGGDLVSTLINQPVNQGLVLGPWGIQRGNSRPELPGGAGSKKPSVYSGLGPCTSLLIWEGGTSIPIWQRGRPRLQNPQRLECSHTACKKAKQALTLHLLASWGAGGEYIFPAISLSPWAPQKVSHPVGDIRAQCSRNKQLWPLIIVISSVCSD